MSQLQCARWNDPSANAGSTSGDLWLSKAPSPLSASCTPAEPVLVKDVQPLVKLRPPSTTTTTASSYGVCRKWYCHLKSHQMYLSAKQARSRDKIQDLGYRHPCNAKPKKVDDQTIRMAFTKSYAFVEPSYLSVLQPSCFRLDVFHDLPISGGDRRQLHKLIWDFLNHHLSSPMAEPLTQVFSMTELQCACLTVAMTNPAVCLCMLTTETLVQKSFHSSDQD